MKNLGRMTLVSLAIAALPGLAAGEEPAPHRSPIALALSADGARLLTANQSAGTVSLIDAEGRKVLDEVAVGEKPAGVAFSPDGRRAVVANWYGYDVVVLEVQGDRLAVVGRVDVGPEPRGVAIGPDGKTAYVAVGAADEVARVDLDSREVTGRLPVGREPRSLAFSPDGGTLVVANARSRGVSVVDVAGFRVAKDVPIDGENPRQITAAADGRHAYLANMYARGFATTRNNIDLGWVLGQRLTRIDLTGPEPYATISLDPRGRAAGDAHGVAAGRDGRYIVVSLGGTHELMIFRAAPEPLPWRVDGSRDLMPPALLNDETGRFRRLELGGRPTELAFAPDSTTLYVANYLGDSVQVVDVDSARLLATIPLGAPEELSLARRGEILFHDATRSFNQWYSCNTCHSDGHTNGLSWDTLNDGRQTAGQFNDRTRKKAPTLRRVTHTAPWTWHGWQTSLEQAVDVSFTTSMQGPKPTDEEARALVAFMDTLDYPRNPYREPDGSLSPEAERGKAVFRSAAAACATCHKGPEFTDGKIHVVGLEEPDDVYRGYNPPSLVGVRDKYPYLHDARSATLHDALSGPHAPEMVGGDGLSEAELADLIAYLKSL